MLDFMKQRDWHLSYSKMAGTFLFTPEQSRADSIIHLIGLGLASTAIRWLVETLRAMERSGRLLLVRSIAFY